eukprot:gnl/MRDRNA2_/MRDRNA2_31046_c0_seq2.p1 gnl/MRDRNA2_/MRDRNA2_31046_c0~~gnl/MRDRNA2_/MRDRNA2_31046_c0_seq2.p1  ORF type:complete len:504 (-),score=127.10 gnl/MRDRNA2_/MRDRNA2_31046_c0_seq2:102-1613(-)
MSAAQVCSAKVRKFGVLGAGIVSDPLAQIKLAQFNACQLVRSPEGSNGIVTGPGDLTRQQVLQLLVETTQVQAEIQQKISLLARKLAKEKGDKKKKKQFGFIEAHDRLLELGLPQEPLERHDISEEEFQRQVTRFTNENDEEVMKFAEHMLRPAGKGDRNKVEGITKDKIIEIHKFMEKEMLQVLNQFKALPQEERRNFTGKACETTAELLVSIAVERQFAIHCEDVEQAVLLHEKSLQDNHEFTQCTEHLAGMMAHLIGAAKPRVSKEQFIKILEQLAVSTKSARVFAKQLADDYRSKQCNIIEAYQRFKEFAESAGQAEAECSVDGEPMADQLSAVEMRVLYSEYADDERVQAAWVESSSEGRTLMEALASGVQDPSILPQTKAPESPSGGKKKLKPSEIVEMQELMVDELKRLTEAVVLSRSGSPNQEFNEGLVMHMIQTLASSAVERRYGVTAEEMTLAGFQQKAILEQNERFKRATDKQKQIMMHLPRICGSMPSSSH